MTIKVTFPIILCIFGLGFHDTASISNSSNMNFLTVTFAASTPNYTSKFFYMFYISRLSKCFLCVASKAFLLKEQAYRKALKCVRASAMKKDEIIRNGFKPKAFIQVNKKSLLYKRACF